MNHSDKEKLEKLRVEIDTEDKIIVEAVNRRTKKVLEIGKLKEKNQAPVYAPDREHSVYEKVFSLNEGPITNKSLQAIYREIMSASLALERKISIGYLGPEGSYTHQACIKRFGASLPFVPLQTIQDGFKSVENGECDYSIVPVENSTEGGVNDTLDMFVESPVHICSELSLRICHNLMSLQSDIKQIKKIYSNPQVFGQCRQWILSHMPHVDLVEVSSSSRAAQMAAKDKEAGAIAGELCAQIYQIPILCRSIQDKGNNVTRFAVLAKEFPKPTGNDKTSLLVFIKDKVGVLHDTLLYFKENNINLTRIESRPSKRRPWEYFFYIDFIGHYNNEHTRSLLESLKEHCELIKVLGSYPVYSEPAGE
ncbi:MAG: prephenate dehydratase [bacterium]|nr:prephenate dehydratase [bacterium]